MFQPLARIQQMGSSRLSLVAPLVCKSVINKSNGAWLRYGPMCNHSPSLYQAPLQLFIAPLTTGKQLVLKPMRSA